MLDDLSGSEHGLQHVVLYNISNEVLDQLNVSDVLMIDVELSFEMQVLGDIVASSEKI